MAEVTTITIPYTPRYPDVHDRLEASRFVVLVAHRRFGKTVLAVNHLIKMALTCAMPRGSYAYVAPFRNQAKAVAWDYLKHYTAALPGRAVNESELSITLPTGAKLRVFGADNPDALRGLYFDGVVLDEVAQMRPEVWEEIVQPALADRRGWTLFIGTPKGVNIFSELYNRAASFEADGKQGWAAMSFPVTKTDALPREEVERLRGELSDNAWRQEMLCDFGASSDDVLIPLGLVVEAQSRTYQPHEYEYAPLIIGVDPARFGDDSTVIFIRRGLVAFEPIVLRKADTTQIADRVAQEIVERRPQAVFIDDTGGYGAGPIDRLRLLGHAVQGVNFGSAAREDTRFQNRRVEMWHNLRDWLRAGGALPPSERLKGELSTPTYGFNARGLLQLESKKDVKERLGRSPDLADALALTFAAPVAVSLPGASPRKAKTDYDLLGWGTAI